MNFLEDENYLYYIGGFIAAVCFILIVFIIRRKQLTRNDNHGLVESKAGNSEWVNELLASVLAKETLSESTYLRIWLAALNESTLKHAVSVSYSLKYYLRENFV